MVCGPLSSPLSPALPHPLGPASCLTTGNQPLDRRSLCSPLTLGKLFLFLPRPLPCKRPTVTSLGIVEVPGHRGFAMTYYFRLRAEGRPRICWNERGSYQLCGRSSQLCTRTTRTTSLFGIENVRVVGVKLKSPFENLLFWMNECCWGDMM